MDCCYLPLTQISSLTEEQEVRETVDIKMFVILPLDPKSSDHLRSLAGERT